MPIDEVVDSTLRWLLIVLGLIPAIFWNSTGLKIDGICRAGLLVKQRMKAAMSVLKNDGTRTTLTSRSRSVSTQDHASTLRESRSDALTFHPLPYREIKRRLWHMSPGLLAFGLHIVSHADPISLTLQLIIVGCCIAIAAWILLGFRQIQRQGEGVGLAAVGGYSLSVLLTAFLFPRHLELGLAVLSILAFGDGSATLVGLTFRGPRLWWNRAKSWSGLLGFIVIGSLMTSWIYWGETHNPEAADPAVSYGLALLLTSPAVVAAALAESIRSRINDNIRVGVVAAIALILLHSFRPW